MKDERTHFFVAVENGRVVGYTVATAKEKDGHLVSIAVAPNCRRQRIGADLFFTVANALEEEGVKQIRLEVRKGNGAAISFYERMGFKILSEITHYYSDGEDALVLSRKVSSSPMSC